MIILRSGTPVSAGRVLGEKGRHFLESEIARFIGGRNATGSYHEYGSAAAENRLQVNLGGGGCLF